MAYKQLKLWFDADLAENLATKIKKEYSDFPSSAYIAEVTKQLPPLKLKDRVKIFAACLKKYLPPDYTTSINILTKILGPENEKETGMFKEYYWIMPIAQFVESYGLVHFEISMKAIQEVTKRNTGEYAIRPYLVKYTKQTLKKLQQWSKHPNKHVRRLASEGIRPRLPWSTKLDIFIEQPHLLLPILNQLKDDPSKYVQKSVANCVNDILKDNPVVGKELLQNWAKKPTKERRWIIKHALRNLLKKEVAWANQLVDKK